MNKEIILRYVKLYQNILGKYQIILSEQDLKNIYQLILLVFKLDNLYDLAEEYPPNQHKLASIKTAMISLMPDGNPLGLQAIETVLEAMEKESLLKVNYSLNLDRYLQVASQSIGAPIIMAYLASKLNLKQNIWYSSIIGNFNNQINSLIRLANDYLDTDIDIQRSFLENSQVKAIDFYQNKFQLKWHLMFKYFIHKLHYYFYLIGFGYLRLSSNWKSYRSAIACSESVLDWAFKVYVIDRNSCQ